MTYTITFNELRKIKDMLPHGSMQRIAEDLGISTDTVRNYFGADNYDNGGSSAGIHVEQGPDGGLVVLDDTAILDKAKELLNVWQKDFNTGKQQNSIPGIFSPLFCLLLPRQVTDKPVTCQPVTSNVASRHE